MSLAVELVAATLEELAEEFDHEALHEGDQAAGLAVAALVLRDRAAEALTADPTSWWLHATSP
ncbi:MAG: hypothetical protein L0H41_07085 [Microlunatus sp.]|nr:hypothetical protein [Microlunatus sp.]MDN5769759.1 hypothetical protein [Microlunatus sp.]